MNIESVKEKMENAISFFEKELSTLRTSRANSSILDNILVKLKVSKTVHNFLMVICTNRRSFIIDRI